ncbi:MAG: hypothetical protein WD749_05625 [Phycisphaerales bacterium]
MTKLRLFFGAADRLQQSTAFKIVASIVLLVAAIGAIAAYSIAATAPGALAPGDRAPAATTPAAPPAAAPAQPESEQERIQRSAREAGQRILQDIIDRRSSPANVAVGMAMLAALALVVVWLGLGLTYLALIAGAVVVVTPLWLLGLEGPAQLVLGVIALTASFTAIMQGLRLLLSGSYPVLAIARNMLAEAVRMKVSLIFLVILIFGLAALPLLLDPENPLRYRVQTFLSYGVGGSYWIIATLTVFFCVASVAFEQRDKQIWQTMTKPVAPWQYLAGKWLGGAALSAALMVVCAAGVFLFTEYLRRQPAFGEQPGIVSVENMSADRKILETQVLAARRAVGFELPLSMQDPEFTAWAGLYIEDGRKIDPDFAGDAASLDKVVTDLYKGWQQAYRTISPGESRVYVFKGLGEAKRRNQPITLKFRVDAGGNMPDQLYRITFEASGILILPPREVTLGPTQTLDLYPTLITDEGELVLGVHNGALEPIADGWLMRPNPEHVSFPADGLEVYFPAGTYQANFFRVALILWIKLAFLAMLAVTAATFLSFPVASLVAFSTFVIAEGTGYLSNALEYYHAADAAGQIEYWKIPVRAVGLVITWMFKNYASLQPTTRLVDGRLLDWGHFAWGIGVLTVWTGALFGAGIVIFRRRELATYSGQ